jgi:hypothetical protein
MSLNTRLYGEKYEHIPPDFSSIIMPSVSIKKVILQALGFVITGNVTVRVSEWCFEKFCGLTQSARH